MSSWIFFSLISLTIAGSSFGSDENLSLTRALEIGLSNSVSVQKSEAALEEAKAKSLQGYSGFLPQINLTGSYFSVKSYQYTDMMFGGQMAHVPQIFPAATTTLSVMLPVFDGFANVNRYLGSRASLRSAESSFDWARFQVENEIRFKFFQAVAAQSLREVAHQNLETISDHLDQVKKLQKGGVATQYDILRVEVQLSEAQSEVLKASDDASIALRKLADAIGYQGSSEQLKLEGDLETPRINVVADLKLETPLSRGDVRALSETAVAQSDFSTATSRFWVPKVSVGGNYILYNNQTDSLSDWNQYRAAWNAGVFLTWNLFDGLVSISESKAAQYHSIQAQKSLEQAVIDAPTDFEFWKKRYVYCAKLYDAKREDLEKSKESVRLAQESFRAGMRTNTEVLDAELDLFRSRAGVVNSLLNSEEAKLKLESALGRRI